MKNARMIRRGLLRSARWNDLPLETREFFVRLLLIVDDYGVFEDDFRLIYSSCYPFGGHAPTGDGQTPTGDGQTRTNADKVPVMLSEIEGVGMIERKTCPSGREYIYVKAFKQALRRMYCDYPLDIVAGAPSFVRACPTGDGQKMPEQEQEQDKEHEAEEEQEREPPTTTAAAKNIESELSKSELYGKYVEYYTEFLLIPGCGRVSIEGFTRACIANPDADFKECLESFRNATDGERITGALRYFTKFLNSSDGRYKASRAPIEAMDLTKEL